jgi:plasmid replication initiation protein
MIPAKSPLDPQRYSQADLFICDILAAAPKGDMASMEHPVFSLSTRTETRIKRYENGNNWVEIRPGPSGLATVHDRDVLIFCISNLVAAMNDGREISQVVRFSAADLIRSTNRPGGGTGYKQLKAAFERLQSTQIETNIVTGGETISRIFSIVDSVEIVRSTDSGRMTEVEVKLSDWTFNAIRSKEVLTLSHDYFRLRKPIERRLYELARKHCGMQREWRIGLAKLQQKCGSNSTLRLFRQQVRQISKEDAAHAYFPDYAIEFDKRDVVIFRRRREEVVESVAVGRLDPEVYHDARQVAPGWDVYALEGDWRRWCATEEIEPKNPGRHFIKFCATWAERRGSP